MKLHFAVFVGTLVAFAAVTSARSQGTVLFDTHVAGLVDAPVRLWTGELAGGDFVAALYIGSDSASLQPVGTPLRFGIGTGAGYVRENQALTVPWSSAGSEVYVRMRAWAPWGVPEDPPPYWGWSDVIRIRLGGGEDAPGYLLGLQGFTITPVPEPSTLWLFVMGLALCAPIRRRSQG
jgi:hypothetical protein